MIMQARDYIGHLDYPVVVKADGLAQGKGSIVCSDEKEALLAVDQLMVEKVFGEAGQKVVIESDCSARRFPFLCLLTAMRLSRCRCTGL